MSRLLLLAGLLALLPVSEAAAGAWTRPPGEWFARLALSRIATSSFYTLDGERIDTADYRRHSLDFYGELGLLGSLSGVARLPLLKTDAFETSDTRFGVGDLEVEFKVGVIGGMTPVAGSVAFGFPTGNENAVAHLDGGGVVRLPAGDGEFNTRFTLHVSRSLYPWAAYLSADAGYNLRTDGFSDEYLFDAQVGLRPGGGRFEITGYLEGLGPVGDVDRSLARSAAVGLGEGVQYQSVGLGAAFEAAPGYSMSLDVFGGFGHTTNIYSGANVVIGLAVNSQRLGRAGHTAAAAP